VIHIGAVRAHCKDGLVWFVFTAENPTVASFKVQHPAEAFDATVTAFRINREKRGGVLAAALVIPGIGVCGLGIHPSFGLQELECATFTGSGIKHSFGGQLSFHKATLPQHLVQSLWLPFAVWVGVVLIFLAAAV
jgi:hypothetical protein